MKPLRGLFVPFSRQVRQQVVAVDVHLERLAAASWPFCSFSMMSGSPAIARNVGSQSWCWTISLETTPAGIRARPAHQQRHAERAFPVGVLLAAERRHRAVGPRVHVRPVVGAVHDEGVLRRCRARRAGRAARRRSCRGRSWCRGTATASGPPGRGSPASVCVRRCMCVVFTQQKNGLPASCWRLMKSFAAATNSSSQVSMRLRVSGPVSSIFCLPTRPQRGCSGGVVLVGRPAAQHAARAEGRLELRETPSDPGSPDPPAPPRR